MENLKDVFSMQKLAKSFSIVICFMVLCITTPEFQANTGIILYTRSAKERGCYIVTSSLIGWVHAQNDPCWYLNFLQWLTPSLRPGQGYQGKFKSSVKQAIFTDPGHFN